MGVGRLAAGRTVLVGVEERIREAEGGVVARGTERRVDACKHAGDHRAGGGGAAQAGGTAVDLDSNVVVVGREVRHRALRRVDVCRTQPTRLQVGGDRTRLP